MPDTYYEKGDAIDGKLISCQSSYPPPRKVTKLKITSKHRGFRFSLEDAYCLIDKAYRWKNKSIKKLTTVDDKDKKKKKRRTKKKRREKR